MKKIGLTFLILLLTGCVNTELSTKDKVYNPENEARIRLYGQNGRPTIMAISIDGKKETVNVGGSLGQAFSSFIGTKGNESIGMPESELSKDPSKLSGIISGAFFKEFVIPAGSEVTVNNSIMGNQHKHHDPIFNHTVIVTFKGCTGKKVIFTPEAGKDYEVAPIGLTTGCSVTVYEIK
ncbi:MULTISPECIES: hypothetical protein [Testudinibacter]|uniref:Lipoprotein n=1 Tax=Testudinibacter aquarius TaxID=1524974 RepID=A0A4R3XX60_9PAST|nr:MULTISPECIES: hypothetical protein [Testudinibacter]TNH08684.1 hypothetical protein FHQ30_01915 [Pasteurellaceae bacterium Phil11]KAE9529922.1 hypothetical protein A1D24_07475 [Testudinibacter aquarius]TCV83820.1 hypothetical protein EDC16_11320 [Testudinibacter aquarius]TNG91712.1 hypothetical protein FHQ21_06875 [Testudinibacter aquarius]TNH25335.1 hypothetical protein FHQ29_01695 [Testudinibacter sp. TR-2022]